MNKYAIKRLWQLGLLLLLSLCGCGELTHERSRQFIAEGDAKRGQELLDAYGCDACHTIPGIAGTKAMVGPPLTDWPQRAYIAGALINTPENLVYWLRFPQEVEPNTAMPNLGVTEADARDMSAYLYTIR